MTMDATLASILSLPSLTANLMPSSEPTLSSGVKVRIGVGIALGINIIVGIIVILLLLKRNKKIAVNLDHTNVDEMEDKDMSNLRKKSFSSGRWMNKAGWHLAACR
jgi:hypothetical protein